MIARFRYWVFGWFLLVHIAGCIGLLYAPETFLVFTPLNLLLNALLLLGSHERMVWQVPVVFGAAAFSGWFVEVVGVNTDLVFGAYAYGKTLGFQLLGVPLLIGINWAALTLAGLQVARHFMIISSRWLAAAVTTGILLILDVLMEFVAPKLDFWSFYHGNERTDYPGLHNFAGWAVTGFIIAYFAHPYLSRGINRVALFFLVIQVAFFAALALIL